MGLGNLSKVTDLVSKQEAGFLTQSNLSLKPELSNKGLLSQIGESTCWVVGGSLTTVFYAEHRQGDAVGRFGVIVDSEDGSGKS